MDRIDAQARVIVEIHLLPATLEVVLVTIILCKTMERPGLTVVVEDVLPVWAQLNILVLRHQTVASRLLMGRMGIRLVTENASPHIILVLAEDALLTQPDNSHLLIVIIGVRLSMGGVRRLSWRA